ncbi:farnesyl diphosphate synthase [Longimicrobium sp.]|uniref:polyprenyl synthetase family protein n=1 Tax=Longimicrobium sp. TaxID=2029185 RepID=UPI002E36AA35|nr:farnesyl diphosphate synthase [Longimicrobium sp.]HEX6040040.1 farnesyl diphosphate synthase [Longimicrobium sp.]
MTGAAVTDAPAGFDVHAFLDRERDWVNAVLAGIAPTLAEGAPSALREPVEYALATPGKRLRPILCVSAYRVVRPAHPPDAVYRLACALEIVHTYSLVHDDLPSMDDDALRRGRPTVHVVHGERAALLAGAALIPAAVRVLDAAARDLGLDVHARGRLVAELCSAGGARGMVGGQWLDLLGEAPGARVDADGLERIHRLKTGALLAASLRIGALAAGADARRVDALTDYGRELGLAFQIVDDVLDVTRTDAELGKTAGKDVGAGKATYPSLFGLEVAERMARERVARAVDALHAAGIRSAELEALAAFVLERGR